MDKKKSIQLVKPTPTVIPPDSSVGIEAWDKLTQANVNFQKRLQNKNPSDQEVYEHET